jgi:alanyl-tRNA synthetase
MSALMTTNQLRSRFLEFFIERKHTLVPSSPLIPTHPSAPLFTNAGMIQFLPYFLGEEPALHRRATSAQRCLRVRGKHDDIENVGRTTRHLTFFEMLGNFSFGDYFKAGAIELAWELLTEVLGLSPERLWVTVHETDDEASRLWQEVVDFPADRIQRAGEDNFWEMGATGPCGPCSEIFYDRGPELGSGGGPVHGAEERYVEIWNLVFMSYNRLDGGVLEPLPKKNIDTGMGLERILSVVQGKLSLFDTDILRGLIANAEELTGSVYGRDPETDVSLRILADHARATTFLVADGVVPSNEQRGYVLRRIIRRAVRHAQRAGARKVILPEMATAVAAAMGSAYPQVEDELGRVRETLEREEHRFLETLTVGLSMLDDVLDDQATAISGDTAFKLHDTYGFPIDLTREIATERGLTVDVAGFERAMQRQRELARAAADRGVTSGDSASLRSLAEEIGPTAFVGYEKTRAEATIRAVRENPSSGTLEVFTDTTPFYPESGGQVGDTGTIVTETGRGTVTDTDAPLPGLIRHQVKLDSGSLSPGQSAELQVDSIRRDALRRSHTATHLLHWALRKVFGPQLHQQGSLVAPDYLRFDFNHHAAPTREELEQVERLVVEQILGDSAVEVSEMPLARARSLGALSFFGEKYGENVRVVRAGAESVELCGGTHVGSLGRIGEFLIQSEASTGSNLRRIEALTGLGAHEYNRRQRELLRSAAESLRVAPSEVLAAIGRLRRGQQEREREQRRRAAETHRDLAAELAGSAADGVVVARLDGKDPEAMRELATAALGRGIRAVGLVGSPDGETASVVVAVEGGAVDAAAIARAAAKVLGGGAGGSRRLAMGGGRDLDRADEAIAILRSSLQIPAPSNS